MYKKLAITVSVALAMIAGAQAAAITWGATVSNGFSLANGNELPDNNLVRIGVFSLSDSEIAAAATAGNLNLLNSNFLEVGRAHIGDGLGDLNGHFATVSNFPNTTPNQQMMYWVLASTNNTSDANSLASFFQMGIFYLPMNVNSNWGVPVDTQTPGISTTDLSDLTDPGTSTTLRAGAQIVYGSFPKGTSTATGAPNFGLAPSPVPEPSTFGLLGVTALGFLARRRSK
jgi:hypothetical protein